MDVRRSDQLLSHDNPSCELKRFQCFRSNSIFFYLSLDFLSLDNMKSVFALLALMFLSVLILQEQEVQSLRWTEYTSNPYASDSYKFMLMFDCKCKVEDLNVKCTNDHREPTCQPEWRCDRPYNCTVSSLDEAIAHISAKSLKNAQNIVDVSCTAREITKTPDLNNCSDNGVCAVKWAFKQIHECYPVTMLPSK